LPGVIEKISDAGSKGVPKYGVTWQPIRSLLLRGGYSEGYRAPSSRKIGALLPSTPPRRSWISARGNQSYQTTSIGRSNPNLKPESSTNEFYGAVFEPQFVSGLSLSVNYYRTIQKDAIQAALGNTVILNNEALFPGFVDRATPTAADTAAGWKGVITTIYAQRVNFGEIRNESMDLGATYSFALGKARPLAPKRERREDDRAIAPTRLRCTRDQRRG